MLWLWYLGRPIEERIGPWRTLLLTLAAGIGPNIAQYLISGPFFIGYSGIVMALAGFIWMRERIAPWEGYPLNKGTVLFLLLFIAAIFILQVVAFFIQIFTSSHFTPQIANTAHIMGGLIGALLARSTFFAQRVVR
jgi:GlpG protein